ncbi:pyridoxal phosphate-dependent transferase [Chaetomium fimeti]|uniref:Pyridoxal phosphate-dependent transferase n=1 Tax=Chaetomium fimeti TaxID=1854472 RepID=A0AAE0H8D8_9PEZI|nr:pyridoxal phosphate-dependent transferase [Chaetomium fimeti]
MSTISAQYPEYQSTARLDELRATEYSYLDSQDHVYLDYTGSGLAASAQIRHHNERLTQNVYGNPHSSNPTSAAATEAMDRTRARVLAHLNASPEEYTVIFTPNATGAARLVGEAYPFSRNTRLVLTADNHNSVNGLREFARTRGARTTYIPLQQPSLRTTTTDVLAALPPKRTLLDRLPPTCRSILRRRDTSPPPDPDLSPNTTTGHSPSTTKPSPDTRNPNPPRGLLDRLQSTCRRIFHRRSILRRRNTNSSPSTNTNSTTNPNTTPSPDTTTNPPNTGGNNNPPTPRGLLAYPAQSNFTGVRHPLSWTRLAQKRGYHVLLDAAAYLPTAPLDLSGKPHPTDPNGETCQPDFVIISWYKLFGYPTGVGCLVARKKALEVLRGGRPWFAGGTVQAATAGVGVGEWHLLAGGAEGFEDGTGNFLGVPDGKVVDERIVAMESAAARISLRTGCFCNPGAGQAALGLDVKTVRKLARARQLLGGLDEVVEVLGIPSLGAIRVSFGLASTTADVDKFIGFAEKTYKDRVITAVGLPPRDQC